LKQVREIRALHRRRRADAAEFFGTGARRLRPKLGGAPLTQRRWRRALVQVR